METADSSETVVSTRLRGVRCRKTVILTFVAARSGSELEINGELNSER
jgi:hypothetical protein